MINNGMVITNYIIVIKGLSAMPSDIFTGIASSSVHIIEEHWAIFRWILFDWSRRKTEGSRICEYTISSY